MNATIPLEDALPWSMNNHNNSETVRTILVCDSIPTDGRFLLYNMTSQVIRSNGSVWWLTASPITECQVATSLKRMGNDTAAAAAVYLRNNSNQPTATTTVSAASIPKPLGITSLATDIASKLLLDDDSEPFDGERYLKGIYKEIKAWACSHDNHNNNMNNNINTTTKSPSWIVLDDVSSLANLVGNKIWVYQFIDSLNALSLRLGKQRQDGTASFGLIIRCSYDFDSSRILFQQQQQQQQQQTGAKHNAEDDDGGMDENIDKSGWVGAGGLAYKQQLKQQQLQTIPWERCLEELADGIVDVLPLAGGYSREAHGRLIFSEYPGGRGWNNTKSHVDATSLGAKTSTISTTSWNKFVMNYCLQDGGVRAIRLRENVAMQ